MGFSMRNIDFKSTDVQGIKELASRIHDRIIVERSARNWVTVYCDTFQDPSINCQELHESMASEVSTALGCIAVIVNVISDHVLLFVVVDSGIAVDIFVSFLDYNLDCWGIDLEKYFESFYPYHGDIDLLLSIADNKDRDLARKVLSQKFEIPCTDDYDYRYYENGSYFRHIVLVQGAQRGIINADDYRFESDRLNDLLHLLGCDEVVASEYGPIACADYDEFMRDCHGRIVRSF